MDAGDLQNDESAATLGPRFMVGDEVIADHPVIVENGVMARGHDAVADGPPAQRDGLEEMWEQ
ncbi:hypothetical protein GCM10009691_39340 [Brevibacterium picturae]|uniref:Uncharacterized protein n=1 Tax=Brevibacterium picturae TaxID=260553 RepID=A0ABN2CNS4_9MICO